MRSWTFWLFVLALTGLLSMVSRAAVGNQSDEFYDAIRNNNLARLETMTRAGADVNAVDDQGQTPLMYSASVGSLEAMKYLLTKGANVNAQSGSGLTSLMLSATDINKVPLLLDRGANVNASTKVGRTVLVIAAQSDASANIVRLLISHGADVKVMDAFKTTALEAAVSVIIGQKKAP